MLKWFAVPSRGGGETPPREVVTDDPLATIALSLPRVPGRRHTSSRRPKHGVRKRPREIYAVSRVNPIFEDEGTSNSPNCTRRRETPPESPGKSASSGYESNPTDRTSSSEFSDDIAPSASTAATSPNGSRRGSGERGAQKITTKHNRKRATDLSETMNNLINHHVALSTIPEGQIPSNNISNLASYCIPAPIWPATTCVPMLSDGKASDLALQAAGSEPTATTAAAIAALGISHTRGLATATSRHEIRRPEEYSRKQQRIIGSVKDLWDKSGMKVNGSRRLLVESDEDEDSLGRNNNNNNNCDTQMPPAQTLDPPPPPPPPLPSTRCTSSSSSSGYSEISLITPPRRSVSPPNPCALPPVFLHSDLSLVSNSVRNAMIYGTLCRIKCASGVSVVGASYEKLLGISRTFDAKLNTSGKHVIESPTTSWESFPDVATPVKPFQKTGNYYPPSQRPDFTLDIPGAERLLRKIQASKRQRCWCRLSVSLLGLLFFLLSVMAVSMIYTRGRRLFGSL